jgi:hypothetical protein
MGRFSSSSPIKGRLRSPERGLIWGPPGVGKTETLAQISGAVFVDLHGSTSKVDVSRVCDPWSVGDSRPPQTYEELRELLQDLPSNPGYKWPKHGDKAEHTALVLDGFHDIDKMIQVSAAQDHNAPSLDSIQWKAGYSTVIRKWQEFLQDLAAFQAKTGAAVWGTAHDRTFSVPNPDGPEFLAYSPNLFYKVSEKNCFDASKEIVGWCDVVLYLTIEDSVRRGGYVQTDVGMSQVADNKTEKDKFAKAGSSGRRACYTRYTGWCQYAKNRIGLPSVMYAGSAAGLWAQYQKRLEQFYTTDPVILKGIIEELLMVAKKSGAQYDEKRFLSALADAGNDPEALRKLINGLESKFAR